MRLTRNGLCHFASIFRARARAASVKTRAAPWAVAALLAGCAASPSAPPPGMADYYRGEGRAAALDYRRGNAAPTPKTPYQAEAGAPRPSSAPDTPVLFPPGAAAQPMPAQTTVAAASVAASSPPSAPAPQAAEATPLPAVAAQDFPARAVFFPRNGYRPDARARAALRALAPRLAGARRIVLTGCTDDRGGPALNRALAERRAMAVAAVLQEYGVEAGFEVRIDTTPPAPPPEALDADAPAGTRARSRRVEIALEDGAARENGAPAQTEKP